MKKIFLVILLTLTLNGYCADQWDKNDPQGTDNLSDIDTLIQANNEALDRLNFEARNGVDLIANSVSSVIVTTGSIAIPNAAGTVVRWRRNTSNTTVTWANLDTGSEAAGTYYAFAVADTDATTFTVLLTTSSTTPTGATYYRKLGYFTNNASLNIEDVISTKMVVTTDKFNPDYDSGWFSVAASTLYTKAHSLGADPDWLMCLVKDSSNYIYTITETSSTGSGATIRADSTNFDFKFIIWMTRTCIPSDASITSGYARIFGWSEEG